MGCHNGARKGGRSPVPHRVGRSVSPAPMHHLCGHISAFLRAHERSGKVGREEKTSVAVRGGGASCSAAHGADSQLDWEFCLPPPCLPSSSSSSSSSSASTLRWISMSGLPPPLLQTPVMSCTHILGAPDGLVPRPPSLALLPLPPAVSLLAHDPRRAKHRFHHDRNRFQDRTRTRRNPLVAEQSSADDHSTVGSALYSPGWVIRTHGV